LPRLRYGATPRGALYRLGLLPDPLAWPPWEYVGTGRFDDPRREFRVLYAASRRRTVFVESLARFRHDPRVLASARQIAHSGEPLPVQLVPTRWRVARGIIQLTLRPGQRWLDLRAPATREQLRHELAPRLLDLSLPDLDLSSVVGPSRLLTQTIARWAYDRGAAGLVYHSRFDATLTCWAIFERATFAPLGRSDPLRAEDPDLLAVARLFGLTVEPDPAEQ
jgi:hypothetical protein